jgi:nucleoside-diphosphate-sugar epimerase
MSRNNPCELLEIDGYNALCQALDGCFCNRRVLITGATGFLGPHVVAAGLALGVDLHVLRTGDGIPGVKSWPVRLEERRAVTEIVSRIRPEAVLHLAAAGVTYNSSSMAELLTVNVAGLDCLLTAISEVHACPVVVAGSAYEYAPQQRAIDETDEIGPVTAYGVSKAAATLTAQMYAGRMPITLLRVFSAFGAGEREPRLLPYIVARTKEGLSTDLTPGGQVRDYVYAGDVAECFWRILATPPASAGLRVLNVGCGKTVTLREFVELIANELSERGLAASPAFGARPYRSDEVMFYVPRVERLHGILGWLPSRDIRVNIGRTIDWYLSHDCS